MRSGGSIQDERLEQLRREGATVDPESAAQRRREADPPGPRGYAGRPVLKPPVWTWEVPLYFFAGGAAGAASVVALAALVLGGEAALARAALWVAAVGSALCPGLLISDLGRPARALNMFRVFKLRSPMSVGAWTLLVFGTGTAAALVLHELELRGIGGRTVAGLGLAAAAGSALAGLVMATYTGVLLGVTAIPVWYEHRRLLPLHLATSALGSAAALLHVLAPGARPAGRLLLLAALLECGLALGLELARDARSRPLHEGRSGRMLRAAAVLTGPATLAAALLLPAVPWGRALAAGLFLSGAVLLRFGWIEAGRASALDPAAALGARPQAP